MNDRGNIIVAFNTLVLVGDYNLKELVLTWAFKRVGGSFGRRHNDK